jgi:hypothetical protein
MRPADRLEIDPTLVEEAVHLRVRGTTPERSMRRELESAYALADPELRDREFRRRYLDWFRRLDLDRPVRQVLEELAGGLARLDRVMLTRAIDAVDEGAELYVKTAPVLERTAVLKLRPPTLVDRDAALGLLRRELLHLADLLDPSFGARPDPPEWHVAPALRPLLQDRYRLLWAVSVLGRLERRGWSGAEERARLRQRFADAFHSLGRSEAALFERLARGRRPNHDRLIAGARDPGSLLGQGRSEARGANACAACELPSGELLEIARLESELGALVRARLPHRSAHGAICPQCADLFRVRLDLGRPDRWFAHTPAHDREAVPPPP